MFRITHNLAVFLCAFGLATYHVSAQQQEMLPGPCPKMKPFDFDPSKASGKSFKLIYGEADASGAFCSETKLLPFKDGKNATRWVLNTAQRLPMTLVEPTPENEGKYITFNNDEFVLVFRDVDKQAGITNVGHVFRESDMHDELNDVNHESPFQFHWTIMHTDYENVLMMSACFEQIHKMNKYSQTEEDVEQ